MMKVGGKWVASRCLFDDFQECERHAPAPDSTTYEPHVKLIKLRALADFALEVAKELGDKTKIDRARAYHDEAYGET